jgi:hypothetical protein
VLQSIQTIVAHDLKIPIRLRFVKIPTMWEIRTVAGDRHHKPARFAFGKLIKTEPPNDSCPTELDGWDCRQEFFNLPQSEAHLLSFLDEVGLFASVSGIVGHYSQEFMEHIREKHPTPIDVKGFWKVRDGLKEVLVDQKRFAKTSPRRPLAERLSEFIPSFDFYSPEMSFGFDMSEVPIGVVTITDGMQLLLATIFADLARGLKFKYCARKDCGDLFVVTSKHKRRYCRQYCAHLDSVRKQRRKEQRKRKKANRG